MNNHLKNKIFDCKNYPSKKIFPPKNKIVVFVSGIFNVLHPGHLRLIDFAASQGDFLIIGVLNDDLSPSMSNSVIERISTMTELKKVDQAIILSESPEVYIKKLKPHIVVKGKEHEKKFNLEETVLNKYGGKLIFSSGETKSTTNELNSNKFYKSINSNILKTKNFKKKHNFNSSDLNNFIDNFEKLNVLVIGDTIVDEYVNCDPVGISQEDPTIVVRPNQSEYFLGGAAIVAAHTKSLRANVSYYTILGNDEFADFIIQETKKIDLDCNSYFDINRPTTHKKRYRANGKTLLRVHNFIQQPLSKELKNKILLDLKKKIASLDLIVFSDFNYGMLSQELVEDIIVLAKEKKVLTVADSQSSSQYGDISRFVGAKFITPTEREARLAIKDFSSGLVTVAEKLRIKVNADFIFITLGHEGVLIHQKEKKQSNWQDDLLPAMNLSPRDPAGAGDALFIVSALSLACGSSIWEAAYLGSIAAACQVGKLGNIPLTKKEILIGLKI